MTRNDDTDDGPNPGRTLSRRGLLALSTGAIAGGLAGCGSNAPSEGDPTGTTPTGTGGTQDPTTGATTEQETTSNSTNAGEPPEPVVDFTLGRLFGEANWNPLGENPPVGAVHTVFHPITQTFLDGHVTQYSLDDWEYDADSQTRTLEFKENWAWHNGDPFTAEDYHDYTLVTDHLIDPEGSAFESMELVDTYTAEQTYKEPQNPAFIPFALPGRVWLPNQLMTQWVEQLRDVSSQSERDEVVAQLTEWKVGTDEIIEKGIGTSTYRLTDYSTTEATFEKVEDHPLAEEVAFDTLKSRIVTGDAVNQAIINDTIDIGGGTFKEELRSAAPEHLETVHSGRDVRSHVFKINQNNRHLARVGVRRALACVLDFEKLLEIFGGGFAKRLQTGLSDELSNKYLGKEYVDQFISYPAGQDLDQATAYLEGEDYSRQNGTWVGPEGEPVQLNFPAPTWTAWASEGKAISQMLKSFGFNVDYRTHETNSWYTIVQDDADYDITTFSHGFGNPNPLSFFGLYSFFSMKLAQERGELQRWLEQGEETSPLNGKPLKPTIPTTVGAKTGEDGEEQINIYQLVEELQKAQSEQRTTEIIKTLSWYYNFSLPSIDLFQYETGMWGDTENFAFPITETPEILTEGWATGYWSIINGGIQPATQS